MATAPYGVRLLVGAAVIAIEETRKLPQTILMYPMTVVSTAAHIVMRMQQNLAELVIKGDETLESLFPPKDEQAAWATFDEDLGDEIPAPEERTTIDGERLTEGRFALYTGGGDLDVTPISAAKKPANKAPATTASKPPAEESMLAQADPPRIVVELDYEALTLAQVRARLQSLSVADLEALLSYEVATKARAPFQTLLANRITRATAK
ncbi:MAG: hypothetical protein JWR37_4271 [Mycobacterium sp.]|jgi:hypothetical protein|nr:hypothetical protein [Mycobacterium sp.]